MDTINKEKLILSLIKDDLIHSKIIYNMERMGFTSDCYFLHLGSTIFDLMEFKEGEESDKIFDRYVELTKKASTIDISRSNKTMDKLALKIYKELALRKR